MESSYLNKPIFLNDLIGNGTTFEINTVFGDKNEDDMFDEFGGSSDDEKDNEIDNDTLLSPWTKSFDELRQGMNKVNDNIYKRVTKKGNVAGGTVPINARVEVRYNAYLEKETAPFDSTFLRGSPLKFYTGQSDILKGFHDAVQTMCSGEHAQFVISYKLLYGELGCPPRIKPRADVLFIIELKSFQMIGDINAELSVPEEDRNKFVLIIDNIKQIHVRGIDCFNQGFYKNAIIAFEKAKNLLLYCNLSNDAEEQEQTEFLIKLYTNLAVCYLKVNTPSKTCIMCNEIRRLTNNKPHCKALFQEGRALVQLGEYARAAEVLLKAHNMQPDNKEIYKELKDLDDRYARYKTSEKEIWQKAFGFAGEIKENKTEDEVVPKPFQDMMENLINSFKSNVHIRRLSLPSGLTMKEIDTIGKLAEKFDCMVDLSPINETYSLKRK